MSKSKKLSKFKKTFSYASINDYIYDDSYNSYKSNGNLERQNTTQRHHHMASISQNIIQKTFVETGIAALVQSASPFASLEKEILSKDALKFTGLVVREKVSTNGLEKAYQIYSKEFQTLKYNTPFILIKKDQRIKLEIGTWYNFHITVHDSTSDQSGKLIEPNKVERTDYIEDPATVHTLTWKVEDRKDFSFIICRAEHRLNLSKSILENAHIGKIVFPDYDDIETYIDFSILKECIVEVVPGKNGFEVVRFHGVDAELKKYVFPKYLGSHILHCMKKEIPLGLEGGISLISKDCCNQPWLRIDIEDFTEERDEYPVNECCIKELQEASTFEEMPKDLYKPDLVNNSKNVLYDDVDEERPDGRGTSQFVGMIISINRKGIVLFVPLIHVNKIFCHTRTLKNKYYPQLGDWLRVKASKRRPREIDYSKPPMFSHIAVELGEKIDILRQFSTWQQRNAGGIFEFFFTANVDSFKRPYLIQSRDMYLVRSDFDIDVAVPRKRLDEILDKRNPGDKGSKRKLKFWVTLCQRVPISNDQDEGVNLQLLDASPIEEIIPGGKIISHGIGKSISSYDVERITELEENKNTATNLSNSNLLLNAFLKNPELDKCFSLFLRCEIQRGIITENLTKHLYVILKEYKKVKDIINGKVLPTSSC